MKSASLALASCKIDKFWQEPENRCIAAVRLSSCYSSTFRALRWFDHGGDITLLAPKAYDPAPSHQNNVQIPSQRYERNYVVDMHFPADLFCGRAAMSLGAAARVV
jgi:hypothetical protein